jgi:hypothetical protein
MDVKNSQLGDRSLLARNFPSRPAYLIIIMNENKIIVSEHIMGSQCSLPHSQERATPVYPQPD